MPRLMGGDSWGDSDGEDVGSVGVVKFKTRSMVGQTAPKNQSVDCTTLTSGMENGMNIRLKIHVFSQFFFKAYWCLPATEMGFACSLSPLPRGPCFSSSRSILGRPQL